jgi:hypothetical protein
MASKRRRDECEFVAQPNELVHNPANASRMKRKDPVVDWDGDLQQLAVIARDCILAVLDNASEKRVTVYILRTILPETIFFGVVCCRTNDCRSQQKDGWPVW